MNLLIKNVRVLDGISGEHPAGDVLVARGKFARFAPRIAMRGTHVVDAGGGYLTSGIIETSPDHALVDPHYGLTTQKQLSEGGVTTILAVQPSYSVNPATAQDILNHHARTGLSTNIAPVVPALCAHNTEYADTAEARAVHYTVPAHATPQATVTAVLKKMGEGVKPLLVSLLPHHAMHEQEVAAAIKTTNRPVLFSGAFRAAPPASGAHYTLTNATRTRMVPAAAFVPHWMMREYDKTGDYRVFANKKNEARIAQELPDIDPHGTYIAQCASRPYWVGYSIANLVQRLGMPPKAVMARVIAAAPHDGLFAFKDESGFDPHQVAANTVLTSGSVAIEQKEHTPSSFAHQNWNPTGLSFLQSLDSTQQKAVVAAYSATPAALCGLSGRGRVTPGYWADFQLFDAAWNLRSVFVNGHSVFGDHIEPGVKPGMYIRS